MQKYYKETLLMITSLLFGQAASAQMLANTDMLDGLTTETASEAGLSKVSVGFLIATIVKVILGFLGTVFIVLIIMSGFQWMTAGGNEEQVKKATKTIKNSVIGLIIVLMAYAITYFIFSRLPFSGGGTLGNAV